MKRFALVEVMMMAATFLFAVPASRNAVRSVTLPDGTVEEIALKGDEYAHWWEDGGGNVYETDDDGNAARMTAAKAEMLKTRGTRQRAEKNESRQRRIAKAKGRKTQYTGTKRGLVILVNFQDKEMASETAYDDFDRMFNEEGYSENGHIGSVADYFRDQSYGQFDIDFDIAGPVTVSNDYSYYGQNDNYGDDLRPCTMVIEACEAVDADTDFSLYDWDGDGEVDQVFLIYAGYGENYGAPSNTIWPHEWELSAGEKYGDGTGALILDGVKIDTYAVTCELTGTKGSVMNGIGVACHEFSHCLGFPDFYDTSYAGGWGMGAWDLLDCGSYNGPEDTGEIPAGYTSYERWQAGWLEPVVLSADMTIDDMRSLGDAPEAYILYNSNDENEYYLLENRQADRWFGYVSTYSAPSGMLVLHVDYDQEAWDNNTPNSEAGHQRMTIFQANNQKGSFRPSGYNITEDQYKGHLYPYNGNDSLCAGSTPAATIYNANADGTMYMDRGIYSITQNADGTMAFSCKAASAGTARIKNTGNAAAVPGRIYGTAGQYAGTDMTILPAGIYIEGGRKTLKR